MDREWSTSPLARGLRGWDWFALQLEDGRELVYGQIRDARGQASVFAAGSLILADGRKVSLAHEDVVLDVLAWWESPTDGARYPAQWRVRVPGHDIDLQVKPVIPDQELKLSILRYWEGAVDVTGTSKGRGYVELTGYAARESP
jgi:predicted secreted hydrolase